MSMWQMLRKCYVTGHVTIFLIFFFHFFSASTVWVINNEWWVIICKVLRGKLFLRKCWLKMQKVKESKEWRESFYYYVQLCSGIIMNIHPPSNPPSPFSVDSEPFFFFVTVKTLLFYRIITNKTDDSYYMSHIYIIWLIDYI